MPLMCSKSTYLDYSHTIEVADISTYLVITVSYFEISAANACHFLQLLPYYSKTTLFEKQQLHFTSLKFDIVILVVCLSISTSIIFSYCLAAFNTYEAFHFYCGVSRLIENCDVGNVCLKKH